MLDAVFISDLHLHPNEPFILERFKRFIAWALTHTRSVYILGDFFHAWAGDDMKEAWSDEIALHLFELSKNGVSAYFLPGNRDFLLGKQFANQAKLILLPEPSFVYLGQSVMLVHGDRYCTKDKGHQWLRRLTRNWWFTPLFLRVPNAWREKLVKKMRQRSQMKDLPSTSLDIVPEVMLKHMKENEAEILIHGHTHKLSLINYSYNKRMYTRYVLCDWENNPMILSYNVEKGLHFNLLS